ncbi:MAG TPA: glycosyltransferase family 2 protein [Thermoplasmata archaeon]|nr:glycosyltransferase family 2 protein [Thermoplasmata archaeon]
MVTFLGFVSAWELLAIGLTLLISTYLLIELVTAVLRPWESPPADPDRDLPFVSVVIPVYNEPVEILQATIDSWERVRYPAFEIVLADDSTVPVRVESTRVRVIRRANREGFKGGALRNAFPQLHPSSEWMVVFDADFVVDPDVLVRFAEHFQPGVGGIQGFMAMGLNRPATYLTRFSEALHEVAGTLLAGRSRHRGFVGVQGTVQAYRNEAIRDLGGIAPVLTANEDLDTTFRLRKAGWRIVYDPRIIGRGIAPDEYGTFFTQITRWTATTIREYRRHWPGFLRTRGIPLTEKVDSFLFLLTWTNALVVAPTFLFLPWALLVLRLIPLWVAIGITCLPFFVFMIPALARGEARRGLVGWVWYYVLLVPGAAVMMRAALLGLFTEPGFKRTPKAVHAPAPEPLAGHGGAIPASTGWGARLETIHALTCSECDRPLSSSEVMFYAVAALDVDSLACRECLGDAEWSRHLPALRRRALAA